MKSITLNIVLILFFSSICYGVNIRHDVTDSEYISFAQEGFSESGLVVVRPFEETPATGVIIHTNYILTAGHVGSMDGPAKMPIQYKGKEYIVDYVYLFPGFSLDDSYTMYMGYDVSILRLEGSGIQNVPPSIIWNQPVSLGQKIVGVGQGKSSTGLQNEEIIPAGTFRGYENTIDYILDDETNNLLVTDFDSPQNSCNSLADIVYCLDNREIKGNSSSEPLSLEGGLGAGDSGSGIWIKGNQNYFLVGIASGRYYASYCAQSQYVNLTNKKIYDWIVSICPSVADNIIKSDIYQVCIDDKLSMTIPNIKCDGQLLNTGLTLEFYNNPSGLFIWKLKSSSVSTIEPLSQITISTDYKISFSEFIYQNQRVPLAVILEAYFNKADPFTLYWKLAM